MVGAELSGGNPPCWGAFEDQPRLQLFTLCRDGKATTEAGSIVMGPPAIHSGCSNQFQCSVGMHGQVDWRLIHVDDPPLFHVGSGQNRPHDVDKTQSLVNCFLRMALRLVSNSANGEAVLRQRRRTLWYWRLADNSTNAGFNQMAYNLRWSYLIARNIARLVEGVDVRQARLCYYLGSPWSHLLTTSIVSRG